MGKINRRDFFKLSSVVAASSIPTGIGYSKHKIELSKDRYGVLVDTTVCIGCRKCEFACKTAHDLPTEGPDSYEDKSVYEIKRRPNDTNLTVVNAYENNKNPHQPITVKVQCMHCEQPACLSACIVGAFTKNETGAVIWDEDKCIGCRYCMVACPFQIPAYEYAKALEARVVKCDWCQDRLAKNQIPACVDICPVEALIFGKRSDLIRLAHDKIKSNSDKYIDHVYGENEVGGTSWMYLAGKDFHKLDFPVLESDPAPGVSEAIQHGIFAYFVPPVALYALLGGVMWITRQKTTEEE